MTEAQQQEMAVCENCGHEVALTEALTELSFQWLDECTTKTSCPACGSYVIMRVWGVENGYQPVGGEILVVKTSLQSKGDKKK